MSLKNLSKGRFTKFFECPLTAWKLRHGEIEGIDPEDYRSRFLADQGHIIGDVATRWFDALLVKSGKPKGINIDAQLERLKILRSSGNWLSAGVSLTQQAMNDPNVWAIYEATFNIGPFTTRADVLARSRDGSWNMIEVKSSMEKRDSSHVYDMAYTSGVLLSCGVRLHKIGLMRIDDNFILKDDTGCLRPGKLLNLMDINWKLQDRVMQTIAEWNTPQANGYNTWQMVDWITAQSNPPPANWSPKCKECPSCRQVFVRGENCHPVLDLPHIGNMDKAFQELSDLGVFCLEDVPAGFFNTTKSHERTAAMIVETIKKKQIFVGQGLKDELRTTFKIKEDGGFAEGRPVVWPVLYLDFEYLQTAIPLYSRCHPYEAVPFQYSLHSAKAGPGKDQIFLPDLASLQHREHLTDPAVDGRTELAQRFIQDIEELGKSNSTIMVYNKVAEQTCIEQLAAHVEDTDPSLASKLRDLYPRMVDLYAIVSKPNLYHPDFHGQFKLKTVIKAFNPELYEKSEIKSGDAALATYGELAYTYRCPELTIWETTDEEKNKLLEELKQYCNLDTYALVILHYNLALLAIDCPTCFDERNIAAYRGDFRACPKCLAMISPKDRGHALRCDGYKARMQPWKIAI